MNENGVIKVEKKTYIMMGANLKRKNGGFRNTPGTNRQALKPQGRFPKPSIVQNKSQDNA